MAKRKLNKSIIKRAVDFVTEWPKYLSDTDKGRYAEVMDKNPAEQTAWDEFTLSCLHGNAKHTFSEMPENVKHPYEMIEAARQIMTDIIVYRRSEAYEYMHAHDYTDKQMKALRVEAIHTWVGMTGEQLATMPNVPRTEAELWFSETFSETALIMAAAAFVNHCDDAVSNSGSATALKELRDLIADLIDKRWTLEANPITLPEVEGCVSMFYSQGTLSMMRICEWEANLQSGNGIIGEYRDSQNPKSKVSVTISMRELKRMPVTAQALLLYGMHKLTHSVSWRKCPLNGDGTVPLQCREVTISYDEYMTLRRLKDRKQVAKTAKRDISVLENTRIRAHGVRIIDGDKADGKKRIYQRVTDSFGVLEKARDTVDIDQRGHIKRGEIVLRFASDFVKSISSNYIIYMPAVFWRINLRAHPGALSLGLSLWQLLTLPGSRKRVDGTRIISVRKLTEYDPSIPQLTEDSLRKAKNPTRTFWEVLEGDIGELQDIGLIECELCDAKGKTLSDDEKAAVKTWGVAKNLSMCIKMREPYLTAFREEQAAAEAKKRRRIAAAKRRKANDKAQNAK